MFSVIEKYNYRTGYFNDRRCLLKRPVNFLETFFLVFFSCFHGE